jgi:D-proline reductase (dithiol) PrdB
MTREVDSYRYISGITKRLVKTWIKMEPACEIPWQPIQKPISACKIALISSGGIALKDDKPFDQDGERRNPWWGDPTFRKIPRTATEADINMYHLHVNPDNVKEDINCLLPIQRLIELEEYGEVGQAAETHYSFMGYILDPEELVEESTPAIVDSLRNEEVDLVILVPA